MGKADDARQRAADLADKIDAVKSAIAARRAAMAKARARALSTPSKGRLATGWFASWSRQVGTLAQSVAKLDRLTAKLPKAVDRADYLAGRAKINTRKKQQSDAFIAAVMPRLDALRAVGPSINARWDAERKAEAKRVKARKKELRKRHCEAEVKPRPPVLLPDPIQQPVDVGPEFTPNIRPEGYGFGSLLDDNPRPSRWDARHVATRLIEAQRVVRMLPESIGPKGFGRAWPEYMHGKDDLTDQEAAAGYRPRAAADEIARALEAIAWPIQFLSNRGRYTVALLTYWADEAESPDAPNSPTELLQVIATALNAAKEPIR